VLEYNYYYDPVTTYRYRAVSGDPDPIMDLFLDADRGYWSEWAPGSILEARMSEYATDEDHEEFVQISEIGA
jgi:hypothetical protein